ncbi:MAG: TolC family outer membrane protein [Gemmobacter sp.]|uniref:TolC family outer membrane protein n=1 Tax=Gemmobacter sp. TaxID=1898957 RepID=UPI001A3E70E2|nr:TolC family outer membrane protein [Gemmobacter sp.]MBL8560741.1 TolC family outer membrane protein [Gemmobacter sp.]
MIGLKRKLVAGVAAAVLTFATPLSAAWAESLGDALVAAYRNSHLLDQNRALLAAADEDVAQAVSALRPVITFAANYNKTRTLPDAPSPSLVDGEIVFNRATSFREVATIDLAVQLTLLDFGRTRAGIDIAKESVLATRAALIGVEQDVLLTAVQAYVNVRLSLEILNLRQNYVNVIGEELRATQDRFDVGEVTRTDVSLAEATLAEARAALAAAEGDVRVARESYKAAVGAYPGKLSALPKAPRLPGSVEAALSVARRTHPDMIRQQHLVKVADLNIELANANMRPSVTARATASLSGGAGASNDFDSQSIGVTASQTLYAGGRLSSQLRQAQMQREAQRASLHQTAVLLEQNLGTAWAQLDVSAAQISANARQIEAAQVAFQGLREEAKLGARTTLEVLDAEQDVLDARAAKVQSEAQRYFYVYQVLASMGQLTVKDLNLGIPTYDVTGYYNLAKDAPTVSFQGESLDRVLKALGKE